MGMARGRSAPYLIRHASSLTRESQTKKVKKGKKASKGPPGLKGMSESKIDATSGSATGAKPTSAAENTSITKRHQAPQVEEAADE